VVLDEATARVDPQTEARIDAAVTELMRGRTTLVIAHRLSTLQSVDDIVVFEAGRVVEFGARRPRRQRHESVPPHCSTSRSRRATTSATSLPTASSALVTHGLAPNTPGGTREVIVNVWKLAWRVSQHEPPHLLGSAGSLFVLFFVSRSRIGWVLGRAFSASTRVTHRARDAGSGCWPGARGGAHGDDPLRRVPVDKVWLQMQTLLRANMLTAQVASGGPEAGQPVGSAGEAITHFRDDTEDVAQFVDGMVDVSAGLVFTLVAGLCSADQLADRRAVLVVPLVGVGTRDQARSTAASSSTGPPTGGHGGGHRSSAT
jgi:hypothetical protein